MNSFGFSKQPKLRAWQGAKAAPFPWHLGKGHQSTDGGSERGICFPQRQGQIQHSSALLLSLLTTALARTFKDQPATQSDNEGLCLLPSFTLFPRVQLAGPGPSGWSVLPAPAGLLCRLPSPTHPLPAAIPFPTSPILNLREQSQQKQQAP